mgnify:CR=1 FL=1
MALPSAGNSISFKQINDELGNDSQAQLDLETAAETGFGLSKPHGLNEMFGLSLSRLEIVVRYLKKNDGGGIEYVGWSDGDLDDCAGLDGSVEDNLISIQSENDFNEDGTVSDGDVIFANSTGTTKPEYSSTGAEPLEVDAYLVETTQNNIFLYDKSDSDISNVRSRTPNIPTKPTLVANSSTQITVTIPTTNTQVTKTFKIQRSIDGASFSDLATITPSAKGNFANTSVNTTYVDSTGISAGDVVKYQVRGQNDFTNSNFSQESNTVTTPAAGTAWSNLQGDPSNIFGGNGDTEVGGAVSIDLANGSGDTVITLNPSSVVGVLSVAYSTSNDPGPTGTANGGSGFGSSLSHRTIDQSTYSSGTLHLRFRFAHTINKDGVGTYTVDFANNGETNGDLNGSLTFGL